MSAPGTPKASQAAIAAVHPRCVCIRNDAGEVISPRRDCPVMVAFDRTGL